MEDLEFIKNFTKISIPKICKEIKVDKSNLRKGKCSKEKIVKVRKHIEKEIANLYIMECETYDKENSSL